MGAPERMSASLHDVHLGPTERRLCTLTWLSCTSARPDRREQVTTTCGGDVCVCGAVETSVRTGVLALGPVSISRGDYLKGVMIVKSPKLDW